MGMDINFILFEFKYAMEHFDNNSILFLNAINSLSDYIMYEQTIIKKDNMSSVYSTITYDYDELSYDTIDNFISSIYLRSYFRNKIFII